MSDIELLAPAGEFDTALAAFEAGADAVYLGMDAFSARAQAVNFSADDLKNILKVAHAKGKRVYVTFNTLLSESELPEAVEKLALLEQLAPDALIVQDLAVARLVRSHFPTLALHASTQMVAHNLEGVLAMKELGFTRVVLSRELPIADIASIAKRCGCELEVFVHGALCYSVSGLCLFSAMEKRRSGNRGRCAYCCRLACNDGSGNRLLPFSMKDLRLDDHLDALREAGVASLKIEGRMKNALYVASVVRRYRELLDSGRSSVSREDLETVFSRATTSLYADGWEQGDVIDPTSLGHRGTPIGTVKRITKDRDGRTWLRFHTSRAIEKHDGLQFAAANDFKPVGMGIGEMRLAISRHPVFEVPAGSDVEVEITPDIEVNAGDTVFCSMSNAVKRRFPIPSFRPSDYPGGIPLDVQVKISRGGISVRALGEMVEAQLPEAQPAKKPELTAASVRKCFEKLGDTDYALGNLQVEDPDGIFAPASILNSLRRDLIAKLDGTRAAKRNAAIAAAMREVTDGAGAGPVAAIPARTVKVRLGQKIPDGTWDEVVVAIGHSGEVPEFGDDVRLALPVFTREADFNKLRNRVKGLVRCGYVKWEAADLAGLRMLRELGISDITGDWSLYAFNPLAAAELHSLGVRYSVGSPEGTFGEMLLARQTTPLFISATEPAGESHSYVGTDGKELKAFELDGLWITVRPAANEFAPPEDAPVRFDYSWDLPEERE